MKECSKSFYRHELFQDPVRNKRP
uniref:Uncharacterized protein n=1 Tax=Arundo donax TaxID=35708 RepID=A0A0A9GN59_ARUDO